MHIEVDIAECEGFIASWALCSLLVPVPSAPPSGSHRKRPLCHRPNKTPQGREGFRRTLERVLRCPTCSTISRDAKHIPLPSLSLLFRLLLILLLKENEKIQVTNGDLELRGVPVRLRGFLEDATWHVTGREGKRGRIAEFLGQVSL